MARKRAGKQASKRAATSRGARAEYADFQALPREETRARRRGARAAVGAAEAEAVTLAAFSGPPETVEIAEGALGDDLRDIKERIEQRLVHYVEEQRAAPMAARRRAGRRAAVSAAAAGPANVVGVGIGSSAPPGPRHAATASSAPGSPSLILYVVEPMSAEQARSVAARTMDVPALTRARLPVSVVVTGVIEPQPHRFRLRPAPGGISAGHFRITAGTLGCLAVGLKPPRDRRLLILSNNHVLADSNGGVFGDCISQPGPLDSGACPADEVARLERFVPIDFSGAPNLVDCATAWADPARVRKELVFLSGGRPQFFSIGRVPRPAVKNLLVGKSGRTTQLTRGRVIDVNATVTVNYGFGRLAVFRDQIAVQGTDGVFSQGGDSGSVIWTWDETRTPVALLFAGGGGTTFANKLSHVLAALDIGLFT